MTMLVRYRIAKPGVSQVDIPGIGGRLFVGHVSPLTPRLPVGHRLIKGGWLAEVGEAVPARSATGVEAAAVASPSPPASADPGGDSEEEGAPDVAPLPEDDGLDGLTSRQLRELAKAHDVPTRPRKADQRDALRAAGVRFDGGA